MSKNIEMNYKTESGYEVVYPSVMVDNIGDLQSYLEENYYNKGEVDGNTWAVGDIRPSTRTDLSDDWHLCDGSGVSSVSWPELYQIRSEDWKPFASYQESSMYNAIQNNTNFARDPVTGLEIYITSLTLNTISFNYRFSSESVTWKSTSVSIAFSSSYGTPYVRKIVGYNNTFGICVELNDTAYAVPLVYKNETFIATTRPFRNNGDYDDWYDAFCNEYGIYYISGQQNTLNIAKQNIGSATSANIGENIKLPYTSVYTGQINCCLVGKYMICGGQIKLNSTNFNEQFMVNSINLDNMSIRTLYNTTIDIKTTRYAINFFECDNNYCYFQLITSNGNSQVQSRDLGKTNGVSYTSKLISLNYTVDDIIKVSDKLILKLNGTSNNIDCYTINSNYELTSVSGYPVSISSFNSGYLIQSDKLYLYHYNQTIYTEPALPNIPVTASDYYYYIKTK